MIIYIWVGFNLCYGMNATSKEFIRDLETGKAIVFEMSKCIEKHI